MDYKEYDRTVDSMPAGEWAQFDAAHDAMFVRDFNMDSFEFLAAWMGRSR